MTSTISGNGGAVRRSRVPDIPGMDDAQYEFLDALDKRDQRAGELPDLADTATLAEVITAYNALLQAFRTR